MNKFSLFFFISFFSSLCFSQDGGLTKHIVGEGTVIKNLPKETQELEDLNSGLMDRTNQAMIVRSLNSTQEAFDTSLEKDNTRVIAYNPLTTVKIRVREFMSTLIVLPEKDGIKSYKLADSTNFSFQVMGESESGLMITDDYPRSGVVEVAMAGADTSLHIIGTSGNIYTFYVRGDTWDSPYSPTLKVLIKDEKLTMKLEAERRRAELKSVKDVKESIKSGGVSNGSKTPDYLEEVEFDASKINFNYKLKSGDKALRPYMVYDDGTFTYFRFAKSDSVSKVKSFPAVYRVADGSDVPTNATPIGSTIRVEGVDNNWTLRLGDSYLCVERVEKIPNIETSMNAVINDNK